MLSAPLACRLVARTVTGMTARTPDSRAERHERERNRRRPNPAAPLTVRTAEIRPEVTRAASC